ncbi:helix-turn-helix domain-containing protein [Ferriphaselus sp. R-1]|uniref:helix-turn-helix domain-containing protein n=1 Tax=Ferriphaselus sp. R-1 TaxID=1485544 RepID=UPI00068B2ABE|nr:helix-turn-helix domain-containing protein [Ferriphaselus sp. R-1]
MSKECGCGPVGENEIARYVRDAVNEYFSDLEGEHPSSSIYDMVVRCVEKPLIETVLHHAGGNQTRAAELLGINRNTLRKKMQDLKIK